MEAAETAQAAEGAQEGQAEETQAPGFDMSAIESAMDNIVSTRLTEFAQQYQQAPEPEPEPEAQFDADDLYGDDGEMDPAAAQQLLAQMTGQQVQEAVKPLMEKINNMELQRGAEALEQEFPELQQPEVAASVLQAADDYAEQIGQEGLGRNPAFVRVVYLAQKAAERAAGEVPAGTAPDGLEAASGAAVPPPQTDLAQQIVDAGKRRTFFSA